MEILNFQKLNPASLLMMQAEDLEMVIRKIIAEELNKKASATQEEDQFLSVSKTAAMLHVDRTTLWRWGKENYLKPVRIGKKVLYKTSEINKVMSYGS